VAGHPRVGRLPLRHPHHGRRNRHRLLQKKTKGILYHCLSKSAMYKQEKNLFQITLLEQPLPIK
jgi:hypothetical protein